ncbi:hypothetical protein BMS3Abin03_02093 [bacterium BMS3Abin03]|nr:hypothetical protein BMS3Abin03_02093 [bacterium BMS3Abin03]
MRIDWTEYLNQTLNVTMNENYGMTVDPKSEQPIYEIVFKTGRLVNAFDDGLLLEAEREGRLIKIFVPYDSIKCVEVFDI